MGHCSCRSPTVRFRSQCCIFPCVSANRISLRGWNRCSPPPSFALSHLLCLSLSLCLPNVNCNAEIPHACQLGAPGVPDRVRSNAVLSLSSSLCPSVSLSHQPFGMRISIYLHAAELLEHSSISPNAAGCDSTPSSPTCLTHTRKAVVVVGMKVLQLALESQAGPQRSTLVHERFSLSLAGLLVNV
jgi:hypothetical protein